MSKDDAALVMLGGVNTQLDWWAHSIRSIILSLWVHVILWKSQFNGRHVSRRRADEKSRPFVIRRGKSACDVVARVAANERVRVFLINAVTLFGVPTFVGYFLLLFWYFSIE